MEYVAMAEIIKRVSRIVLGGPFGERSDTGSFSILDGFIEFGGTAIETAHSYANGAGEEQIGRWLRKRERTDDVVLITKVGHPSAGELPSISSFEMELEISRRRLGVDCIDILLLHRDPITTPVLQVLQILEELRLKRTIQAYGISNISGIRVEEFDHAASKMGIRGLALISNYYGLARQSCPPWPGTVELDGIAAKWLLEHRRPLLCWSALAQGWFGHRELLDNFRPVYDTPANRNRRHRSDELAVHMGVSGLQIALAYTLSAPFAVLASVGPQSLEELESIVAALSLTLTEQQRVFLERSA